MAITFVNIGTVAAGTGTVSPGLPSGWQEDDIFILHIEGEGEDTSADGQGDFGGTLIGSVANDTGGGNFDTRHTLYWKRATASESAPTVSDAGNHTLAVISAWRGCLSTGSPIDGTPVSSSGDISNTSVSITGISTATDGAMVISSTSAGDNITYSSWANASLASITEAFGSTGSTVVNTSSGSDGAMGCAYGIKTSAGSVNATTATVSAVEREANWMFALEPEPTGPVREPDTRAVALGTAGLEPSAIVANVVAPTTGALAFTGYAPSRAEVIIEPPTGGINIWKYVGLKLDGYPPTVDVSGGAVTREPDTVALTITEDTPVRVVNDIPVPDKDTLSLSGIVPTVVINEIELPDKDALTLSGIAPSAVIANLREPSTIGLTIDEKQADRFVGQIREPDTDDLALSGIAPTVIHDRLSIVPIGSLTIDEKQADRTVTTSRTPDTDTLTLSGIVPTAPVANVAIPSEDTLTLTGAVPTIDVTVSPDKDTLTLSGIVPITVVANLREPDTDALAITGYEPTLSDSVIREPGTVALTIDEQTPIPTQSIVKEPPIDALALSGEVPISNRGDTREPSTDALSLSGTTPTLSYNYIIEPSEDTLVLSGKQVSVNDVLVEVPTGSINIWKYVGLKLDGFPPSLNFGTTVPVGSLTIDEKTPTVNVNVLPGAGTLSLSGAAPDLLGTVSVDTGSLTLQGYPPVDQDAIVVSVGSLTLAGQTPTLKGAESPSTASLTLTGYAPTADYQQSPDPAVGTLTLAGQAPTVVESAPVSPSTGALAFNADPPEVGTDSIITLKGSLALSGQAPTVQVKSFANPGSDSLALSGKTPTIAVGKEIEVGTGSLTLFSTVIQNEPDDVAVTLTGQPVTIFYRDGTLIENPSATTSVPSNYEQCDYSGFRQLPGSLKLTWNKHAVRKKSWEERHPQDTLQSAPERQKGSKRPEQPDRFIEDIGEIDPEEL